MNKPREQEMDRFLLEIAGRLARIEEQVASISSTLNRHIEMMNATVGQMDTQLREQDRFMTKVKVYGSIVYLLLTLSVAWVWKKINGH